MVRDVETIRGRVQSFALRCDLRWRTGALEELVPRGLCADAPLRKAFPFKLLRLGVALVKIFARQLVCLSCALARSEKLTFIDCWSVFLIYEMRSILQALNYIISFPENIFNISEIRFLLLRTKQLD